MTALAWVFAALAALFGGGWAAEAGMRFNHVRRLQAELRAAEATIDRFMEAVDTLAAQVRRGVNIDVDAEAPGVVGVLAWTVAAALEAERDAHRATGAELRRVEGECAALRDQCVRRGPGGRFVKGAGV